MKLKICGVKSLAEAELLLQAGIQLVGINFITTSSRMVTIEQAEQIAKQLKSSGVQIALLFADQPIETINDYAQRLKADFVQLHGSEEPAFARQVKAPVIKAVAVKATDTAAMVVDAIDNFPADYFVLDRFQQGRGPMVDLALAKQVIAAATAKIFLAGGLDPANLPSIVAGVTPYGIDIASGVRTDDRLDIAKLRLCQQIVEQTN